MNDKPTLIDENTRFNLKFNNIYALLTMTAVLILAIAAFDKRVSKIEDNQVLITQKQDQIIASQKEIVDEFKSWKKQWEARLGTVESIESTVVSYLENHLQVRIIK